VKQNASPPWPLGGSVILAPLSLLYQGAIAARNLFYDRGWWGRIALPVPVLSIGNLSLGGSGKTPLVLETVELLRGAGRRPAVVSRGYGRSSRGVLALEPDQPAAADLLGDEPAMLQQRGVPVAVGRDRVAAAKLAIERLGCDVLILDDGFQHRRLGRAADLVVLDASLSPSVQHLLPRGILREGWPALARADAVVLTRTQMATDLAEWESHLQRYARDRPCFLTRHQVAGLRSLEADSPPPPGSAVVLLSGIARPDLFERDVRALGYRIESHLAYRDHHPFTTKQLAQAAALARRVSGHLVTTEKDLTRIPDRALRDCRPLLLQIREVLERPQEYLDFLLARIA